MSEYLMELGSILRKVRKLRGLKSRKVNQRCQNTSAAK